MVTGQGLAYWGITMKALTMLGVVGSLVCGSPLYTAAQDGRAAGETAQRMFPAQDTPPGTAERYPSVSGFLLADQFNHWHTYYFPRQKISFLAIADQAGSAQLEAWIQPVYARYQEQIDIHGVAAMPAVPEALRGLIRLFFKSRLQYPVMLDWHSRVAQQFGYEQAQANVFIIDPAGAIRLKVVGAVAASRLQGVFTQIDWLLQCHGRLAPADPCQGKEP